MLDRVQAGERLTVTRDGRPVAELRPLSRPSLTASELVRRWSKLPRVDPDRVKADLDAVLAPEL